MNPQEAADLAARTLAAIDRLTVAGAGDDYCRERVASDLAGLRLAVLHDGQMPHPQVKLGEIRALFADGLRRTAALYGVTP